jgi:2-haloacid dehalogenase
MLATIHAIIFDFGGVLINWDPHKLYDPYFNNDRQAIDRFLAEINFSEWNLAQDKGYPFAQAVLELSARFPQYAELIHAYDEQWEESITGTVPGTVEILQRLKAAGFQLYGLTNWSAEKFSLVRPRYRVFDLFEDIIVSGDVKLIKPDPAIFKLLLDRINRQPEECLLVDDSQINVAAARRLGFSAIHFVSPMQLRSTLEEMGIR